MKKALLIAGRDLKIYFTSFIAYAVCAVFLVISGFFFFSKMTYLSFLSMNTLSNPEMAAQFNFSAIFIPLLYGDIAVILLMVSPLMTMRSFSEEKKSGTYELLVTYPIRDWEIVLGKFLAAAFSLFVLNCFIFCHAILAIVVGGKVEWLQLVWGFFGLNLVGLSFIAVGIFSSSVTENQIVAAMLSFGFLLFFWVLGWMSDMAGGNMAAILKEISLLTHADHFYKGLIDTQDLAYYILFISFFVFSTLRVMETRKWRR